MLGPHPGDLWIANYGVVKKWRHAILNNFWPTLPHPIITLFIKTLVLPSPNTWPPPPKTVTSFMDDPYTLSAKDCDPLIWVTFWSILTTSNSETSKNFWDGWVINKNCLKHNTLTTCPIDGELLKIVICKLWCSKILLVNTIRLTSASSYDFQIVGQGICPSEPDPEPIYLLLR